MARIADPETRRFVREATAGMIVIAGLLALIIVGVARRFGAWEKHRPANDVQPAQVYRRVPRPSHARSVSDPATAEAFPSETEVVGRTSPVATELPPNSSQPVRVMPVSRPSVGPTPSPSQLSPQAAAQTPDSRPFNPAGAQRDAPPPADRSSQPIPTPFRPTPAQSVSQPRTAPESTPPKPVETVKNDVKWTVRVDDTLWTFCARNYGDPQWFRAFHAWLAGRGLVFEQLGPGRILKPPTKSELRQTYPDIAPQERSRTSARPDDAANANDGDRRYVSSGSESLFDIAARTLGQAVRYVELVELNRDKIPAGADYLTPLPKGTQLTLPPR